MTARWLLRALAAVAEAQRATASPSSVAWVDRESPLLRHQLAEREAIRAQLPNELATSRRQLAAVHTLRTATATQADRHLGWRRAAARSNLCLARLPREKRGRYRRLQQQAERCRQTLNASPQQLLRRLKQRLRQVEDHRRGKAGGAVGRFEPATQRKSPEQRTELRGAPAAERMQRWQELTQQAAAEYQQDRKLRVQALQLQRGQATAQIGHRDATDPQVLADELQHSYEQIHMNVSTRVAFNLGAIGSVDEMGAAGGIY